MSSLHLLNTRDSLSLAITKNKLYSFWQQDGNNLLSAVSILHSYSFILFIVL